MAFHPAAGANLRPFGAPPSRGRREKSKILPVIGKAVKREYRCRTQSLPRIVISSEARNLCHSRSGDRYLEVPNGKPHTRRLSGIAPYTHSEPPAPFRIAPRPSLTNPYFLRGSAHRFEVAFLHLLRMAIDHGRRGVCPLRDFRPRQPRKAQKEQLLLFLRPGDQVPRISLLHGNPMVPVHLIPVRRRTVGCDFSRHQEFRRLARRCRHLVGEPLLMPAADVDGAPPHTLRDVRQKGHAALLVVLFQAFQKAKPQLLPCLFRGQRLIGCLRQRINKTFEPFAERLFRRLLSCLRRQRQTLDGLTVRNRFNICIYSFFHREIFHFSESASGHLTGWPYYIMRIFRIPAPEKHIFLICRSEKTLQKQGREESMSSPFFKPCPMCFKIFEAHQRFSPLKKP